MAKTAFCLLQRRRMISCAFLTCAYASMGGLWEKWDFLPEQKYGRRNGSRDWLHIPLCFWELRTSVLRLFYAPPFKSLLQSWECIRCVNRRSFQKQWNQYSQHQFCSFVPFKKKKAAFTFVWLCMSFHRFFTSSTSLYVDACYTIGFVC